MKIFREVYELPFKMIGNHNWVYDQKENFCFQFEQYKFQSVNDVMLDVINGNNNYQNHDLIFTHENGEIKDDEGNYWITIRGWGNLTSPNCLGFSPEEASNIQDTLAQHLIERLNFRK